MTHARDIGVASRSYDFEVRSVSRDGRQLEGYVAVFHHRTRIPDRGGDFEEEIHPGFADRSLRDNGFPVMQFDHGKDPRVGTVPIGKYDEFEKDGKGYHVRGELFDNVVVEPVRQAIAAKAIKGMSFRFQVNKKGGDRWERRNSGMDLRHVLDADVPEAGPVVFPAYAATSVTLRSLMASYTPEEQYLAFRDLFLQAGEYADLADLTGRRSTRGARGGDPDAEPRTGEASRNSINRARALDALRPPVVLPRRES